VTRITASWSSDNTVLHEATETFAGLIVLCIFPSLGSIEDRCGFDWLLRR
jgi:hypothetical protein